MQEKLEKIIDNYGVNNQLRKFSEECFELEEAIIRAEENLGLEKYKEHIAEEIADVTVMLLQFKEYYHIDGNDILRIMNQKIDRTLERIEMEKKQ